MRLYRLANGRGKICPILYAIREDFPANIVDAYGQFNVTAAKRNTAASANPDDVADLVVPTDLSKTQAQARSREYYERHKNHLSRAAMEVVSKRARSS